MSRTPTQRVPLPPARARVALAGGFVLRSRSATVSGTLARSHAQARLNPPGGMRLVTVMRAGPPGRNHEQATSDGGAFVQAGAGRDGLRSRRPATRSRRAA